MEQGTFHFVDKLSMFIKRMIYITGFVWLCYLDHIIGSATGYIQHALKNYTGVVIGVIILTAYKIRDFRKRSYFLWIIVFFLGKYGVMRWADGRVYEIGKLEATLWNIGIYGIIVMRLYYAGKEEGRVLCIRKPVLGIWLIMMLGMVLVRPDVAWSGWFLLFFGCFYLTEFTEADLNNLYSGMLEGIIIGFLLLQTCALMFRPYDMLRYEGMYSNANMNALFYLLTYGAVLCKWYQMKLKRKPLLLRVPVIGLVGILFGLTFLTMGRTALITMLFLTVIFLIFQAISRKRGRWKVVLMDSGAVFLSVVLCFLPVYYGVRYIPAYVDEPLFFEADMNKLAGKIQKGEAVNSSKYTDLDRVLEQSFGRLFWFWEKDEASLGKSFFNPKLGVEASVSSIGGDEIWKKQVEQTRDLAVTYGMGEDKTVPILTGEEAENPIKVRMSIYKYYVDHIRLVGQRSGVQHVWITSNYSVPHAHNIFLYMAGEFGWIIGGLFLFIVGMTYHNVLLGLVEKRQGRWYFRLFVTIIFTTVTVAFGMLEICWTYGQLPFTMLFFVQYMTMHRTSPIQ